MKLIYMTIIAVFFIIVMCIYSVTNTAYGKSTESNCVIQKIYTPDKEISKNKSVKTIFDSKGLKIKLQLFSVEQFFK